MPTPLKQHHEPNEDLQQKQNSSPKFKTFQYIDHENERFQELVFFARIASFAVLTVIVSFFLLALHLAPLWSFLFASLISLATIVGVPRLIRSIQNRTKE